jgi:nucleolar protein 53
MPILKPPAVSPGAPQQHKQPSRKGKKAWRKNVDVSDVQEGLELVRDEVIKGYTPFLANSKKIELNCAIGE